MGNMYSILGGTVVSLGERGVERGDVQRRRERCGEEEREV
jgi:hypothetical protein